MLARFAGMVQDRFGQGSQIAPMTVMVLVAPVPQLAGNKLIDGHAILNQPLVSEERVPIVGDHMPLEVSVGPHDCAAVIGPLQAGLRNIASQIEHYWVLHVLHPEIARRIERIRLAEESGVQCKAWLVTI